MKIKKFKHVGCRVSDEDYILLQKILAKEKISEAEFFRRQIREYGVDSFFRLIFDSHRIPFPLKAASFHKSFSKSDLL